MKTQTPIAKAIQKIRERMNKPDCIDNIDVQYELNQAIQILESLKEEEKEIILSSFVGGDMRGTGEIPFNAEQYFEQTYTQE